MGIIINSLSLSVGADNPMHVSNSYWWIRVFRLKKTREREVGRTISFIMQIEASVALHCTYFDGIIQRQTKELVFS